MLWSSHLYYTKSLEEDGLLKCCKHNYYCQERFYVNLGMVLMTCWWIFAEQNYVETHRIFLLRL